MNTVLMLDLDGPVCTSRTKIATGQDYDPVACGLIAKICRDTGAKIVITSTRRVDDYIISSLSKAGLAIYLFQDPTHWRVAWPGNGRGNDIDTWMKANPGYGYVIIDDDLTGYDQHHMNWLVHVDQDAGFGISDYNKTLSLINNQKSDATKLRDPFGISSMADLAAKLIDQGDYDGAKDILANIKDHPLAQ
jgi:hypothetical protein